MTGVFYSEYSIIGGSKFTIFKITDFVPLDIKKTASFYLRSFAISFYFMPKPKIKRLIFAKSAALTLPFSSISTV